MCHITARFLFKILLFPRVREKPSLFYQGYIDRWNHLGIANCSFMMKQTSFYSGEERFFIVDIKVFKEGSFQLIEKIFFPSSNYLRKQTLKRPMIQIKLWKSPCTIKNFRRFLFEFRFKTKIVLFSYKTLYTGTYSSTHFSTQNGTRFVVERTPHSHIQRYFCHKHDAYGTKADY